MNPGLEYIAGFADADGCFSLIRNPQTGYIGPTLEICNTNLDALCSIQASLIEYGIRCAIYEGKLRNVKWKNVFHLRVTGCKNALCYCKLVKPYLILKAPRVDIIIRFCELVISSKRGDDDVCLQKLTMYSELRLLNERGCKRR